MVSLAPPPSPPPLAEYKKGDIFGVLGVNRSNCLF